MDIDMEKFYIKTESGTIDRYHIEAGKKGPLAFGESVSEQDWKDYLQQLLNKSETQNIADKIYYERIPDDVRADFILPTGLPQANGTSDARAEMARVFNEDLPDEVAIQFTPIRVAIESMLDGGRVDRAITYLQSVSVTPEVETYKTKFLTLLNELND